MYRERFDDATKAGIDRVIVNTTADIKSTAQNQQASRLMREYVDILRKGRHQ
jgi:hypothetical protein